MSIEKSLFLPSPSMDVNYYSGFLLQICQFYFEIK